MHYYIERVRTTILANDFSGENLPLPSMPKSVHLEEGPENHLLPFVDSFKNIMLFHLYLSEDLELGLHVIGEFLDRHTDSNLAEAESLRSSTIVARLSRILIQFFSLCAVMLRRNPTTRKDRKKY